MLPLILAVVLLAVVASFEVSSSTAGDHPPLPGTVIASQLRCQGYLCPSWSLDISRYDTIQYYQEQFEYNLQEALPLAPTSQRSFDTYTVYDTASRQFTEVAADWPYEGIDAYWVSTIGPYANETTPLETYILVPHPDAVTNSGSKASLVRVLSAPVLVAGGRKIAIFDDGTVYDVELSSQKYSRIFSLFEASTINSPLTLTYAHVFDGLVLRSFVMDVKGNSYLINTDFSQSTIKASEPTFITPVKGQELETPIAAHMITMYDGMSPSLLCIYAGNFDTFNFVDPATGVQTSLVSNLYDAILAVFSCNEDLKECDFWRTSAFDEVNHAIYFQAHVDEGDGEPDTNAMLKIGFTQSKIDGEWYPYVNIMHNFMNFGYSGYQYVQIQQ